MRQVGQYDIEDPTKIQGRDEVYLRDRSLAALRLQYGLEALAQTTGRVLILGCGAGRYVRALARERPDLIVHGGDLSLGALREARRRAPGHHYVRMDASRLPYRDATFGAVIFFDLLEHVPEHQRMLDEIARVLVPGGVLHCFVPLEGEPDTVYQVLGRSRWFPIIRWKRDHVGHINHFTVEDVLHEVTAAGLRVDDLAYGFHFISQLHDVVDYWQRERAAGGPGVLPLPLVNLVTRLVFIVTWRLSYFESRLYSGRRLSSGLHFTARKHPD